MTKSSNHLKRTFSTQAQKQIKNVLGGVFNFNKEMEALSVRPKVKQVKNEAYQNLEFIFSNFHTVVKQLQKRQRNRNPFQVNDEYDVQDLLHSLLRIYFEDVRAEEYCPSYAGTKPRIDFYLQREDIAIEAKMASKTNRMKKIRRDLILDKEYYQKKKECKALFCIVYDPNEIISNPRGFEDDLYEKGIAFEAKIFVVPKKN